MSKYGDVHDIFNQHHIQTRAKLDLILAKNSEIDLNSDELEAKIDISNGSLASVDGKVVVCDTVVLLLLMLRLPLVIQVRCRSLLAPYRPVLRIVVNKMKLKLLLVILIALWLEFCLFLVQRFLNLVLVQ